MDTPELVSSELIVPIACHPCLIFVCKVQGVYSYDGLKLVSSDFLYPAICENVMGDSWMPSRGRKNKVQTSDLVLKGYKERRNTFMMSAKFS